MNTLYEHGTLAMLMARNLAGTITLQELLKHGSYGLGTFEGLDGEVMILDNEVYQADSTGNVHHITDMSKTLPFASVHFPQKPRDVALKDLDFKLLNGAFVHDHQLQNVFAALKLHGTLSEVLIRIAPKQVRPYPSLLEVAQGQPTFTAQDISGTIFGYYAPSAFGSVTAAGWHLHFISDDHQFAGHLLSFAAPQMNGNYEVFDQLDQHFPIHNDEFRQSDVDLKSLRQGIAQSEGHQG
ncbi:acetolactate decarboxylase [uncultured Limosilactobacillus sp.]|uniref:acetolactate decarboxylase n=1 Tax=uncultured Limosilactobacillus sp. TaxID=2837629 RepID=UPI0025EE7C7F|nr:acetolactate decarboxylase [uncultured Limosilactobacillus sp.]